MVSGEHNLAMQLSSPTMKQPAVSESKNHLSVSPTRHKHNFRSKAKAGRSRRKNNSASANANANANANAISRSSFTSDNLAAYDMNNTNSPYYKGLTDQSLAIVDSIKPQFHTPLTTDLLSSPSPYYKGLLAIKIGPWTPHNHPISYSYSPSPYYRGLLTDYTLVFHGPPIEPPFTNNLQSSTAIKSIPGGPSSPSLKDLILDASDHTQFEEKPFREKESEAISVLEDKAEKMILETCDDVDMAIQEKPLRESVLEQPSDHNRVEEDDVLVLEEKEMPSVVDVIEEKPLGERVSETSDHLVLKEEQKEKALYVSQRTVVECEEGGDVHEYHYTWAAKYQPMSLDDFICNKDTALELKAKVKKGCGCNHFIFEGPPSVGKRSMIRAMLREVFGADRMQVIEEERRRFNLKGEMVDNVQVQVKKSLHHVEVNLSETKGYEKHVIADLFKETYGQVINNSEPCWPENCKAIILYEAEKLSKESLWYIKWLLEKYKGCNKVFFCCSDEAKLQPVKPLCITVRLSSPSTQELVQILKNIGKKERIKLSPDIVEKIILRSKNNPRQAIRSLEATCRNKDAVKDDDLILSGWEEDMLNIAKKITEEQSPRQLYDIRRKLQSLMIHDVPPDFIYKSLVAELTNLVDESLRAGVAKLDKDFVRPNDIKFETMKQLGRAHKQAESDENNTDSTRQNRLTYLKVEEFIAKFMSWYKNSFEKGKKQ